MTFKIDRRVILGATAGLVLAASLAAGSAMAQDKVTLRLSTPATPTDQRSVALAEVFAPAVADFATFEPHYNATLFKQGTELEAIARGNLEMSITSAQELATIYPGVVDLHRRLPASATPSTRRRCSTSDIMDEMKQKVEDELGVKLLTVMYLGRRQLNLRADNADRDARRSGRRQAAHARHRRLAVPRQRAGRQPDADRLHRGLHGAADRRHRRPGQPAADRPRLQVLRGDQARSC